MGENISWRVEEGHSSEKAYKVAAPMNYAHDIDSILARGVENNEAGIRDYVAAQARR